MGDDYFSNTTSLAQTTGRKRAVLMLIAGFIRELEKNIVLSHVISASILTLLFRFTYDDANEERLRMLLLGLDGAGKTSILYTLKCGEAVKTVPTIGFNIETVKHDGYEFNIWDVGGQDKLRDLWRHHYPV